MAHSIISDEINAGIPMYTLKDLSLVSLIDRNSIICQHIYSIPFIEEHVIM